MPLIATWHPTFAFFHNPAEWGVFTADVQRFGRLCLGKLEPLPKIVTNLTEHNFEDYTGNQRFLAVDIETAPADSERSWTGKDPTRAKLKTIGLGTVSCGVSYEWGTNAAVERKIKCVLADPSIKKVWHNGEWFDLRVLKRYGLDSFNNEDTRDMRRALSSVSPLSLRFLASIYTDFPAWKEDDEQDSKGLVFTTDMEKLKRYNALDCVATARIYVRMRDEIEYTR